MKYIETIMTHLFHKSIFKKTVVISCALLLTGCVQVNFPQVNSLYQMMVPPIDPLDRHRWELEVGSYKAQLYLMTIDGESVFVNENKDILVLRGNTLVSISLPAITDATITVVDQNSTLKNNSSTDQEQLIRTIKVNDTLYETQQCEQWISSNTKSSNNTQLKFLFYYEEQISNNITQDVLRCVGAKTQLHTLNYVNGQLRTLSQYVPFIDQQISLIKVSTR